MANAMGIVKFIGSWFCLVAAVAFLVIGGPGLVTPLAAVSIGFSLAPTGA